MADSINLRREYVVIVSGDDPKEGEVHDLTTIWADDDYLTTLTDAKRRAAEMRELYPHMTYTVYKLVKVEE